MKKLLSLIFLLVLSINISAQMDTEHWFAPMADSSSPSTSDQYLYLSTNETTPFSVSIYNNKTLIATIDNLSKGNPQKYSIPRDYIITTDENLINTKNTMGLHVVGDKKFFANIRFSVPNHAEIITSKGKSALGNNFFIGMGEQYLNRSENTNRILNAMIGVIATEDKTTITLSDYDPNVIFSDGSTDDSKTISLNKGESYIFEAKISSSLNPNLSGLIGAQLDADKPISVTNGNFLSLAENEGNVDILMDQSVPIERIGTEYIILKGNGSANGTSSPNISSIGFMEKALVIATQDNTEIYVNDETTPIATLNKGEFYIIRNKFYNPSSGIYNLYIKTTKPTYVYQLLAGAEGSGNTSEFASGGFNFIPALSCYLPNKIDEIGLVNEMPYQNYFQNYQNTKLNIITEKGATVSVNGTALSSSNGPFAVKGNNAWETYVFPNVSGNISVTSTKAITAGIASGNGAVGYGGYFAGFNSIPVINRGGDCDKGFTLEVDNSYDSYQWYYNGNPYTGTGANSYIINPTESGAYTVVISKNSCGSVTTPAYNFVACSLYTSQDFNIGSCNTILIQPKFTKSTQNIVLSSIKIKTPPTNGTATINSSTGEITYTVTNPNATSDKFVYYFSGENADFPDSETVTVNITITPLKVYNGISKACVNSGIGRFNIDEVKLTDDTSAKYRYFKTYDAANNLDLTQEITTLHPYLSNVGKVFVRITDVFNCYKIAEIDLVDSQPNVNPNNYNSSHCDDDFDGIINIKFSDISPLIVQDYQDFTIEYYLDPNFTGTPLPNDWSYNQDTDVYVRVFSQSVCVTAKGIIHFKIGTKITANDIVKQVCDGDFNNSENIDLRDYLPFVTSETGYQPTFYASKTDAIKEQSPIGNTHTISSNSIYFVKLKKAGICDNISSITLNFGQPAKSKLPPVVTICEGETTNLDAGLEFSAYLWSNGETSHEIKNVGKGDYTVILTSANGCTYTQKVSVVESPKAIVDVTKFNTTICDDSLDGVIEVNLNRVTSAILLNPGIYKVNYYLNSTDANAGNGNTINTDTDWSFSTDTTIFVRIESDFCPPQIYPLGFKFGNKLPLIAKDVTHTICDDDLDGSKTLNLDDYKYLFSSDNSITTTYYLSEADAKKKQNVVSASQTVKNIKIFYIRFETTNYCADWGKITLNINTPTASEYLKDKQICKEATTDLDAGPGFKYKWSTGEETRMVFNKGIGDYYVDLEASNGCVYRQHVKITAAPDPIVTVEVVNNNSITINATGGSAPYEYSLDGIHYQSLNMFYNLSRGIQKVYVRGKEKCAPVEKEFLIINLVNAITPNGDGKNDVLDYSDLRIKKDVKILIADRFGSTIYQELNTQKYIWDGKTNGRPVPTGTYWYVLEWTEPDTGVKMTYKGWILVKNRN